MDSTQSRQPLTRARGLAKLMALLLWLSPFSTCLLAQTPSGAPSTPYEKTLVSQMAIPELFGYLEKNEALMVVPISQIMDNLAQEATAAPIPSGQLSEFVDQLNHAAALQNRQRCDISPAAWGAPPLDDNAPKTHVLDAILAQDTLLLGRVEHITPTWDFHYRAVTNLVFVRISEVLEDGSGSFAADQLVTHIRWWGETRVLGIPLCTDPPFDISATEAPMEGDQVILTGSPDLWNPDHVVTHHTTIFPVSGGIVSPPAGAPGYSLDTTTLDQIREGVRR